MIVSNSMASWNKNKNSKFWRNSSVSEDEYSLFEWCSDFEDCLENMEDINDVKEGNFFRINLKRIITEWKKNSV